MIKCVVFDYGRVLAYPSTGSWYITPKTAVILGKKAFMALASDLDELDRAFQKAHKYLDENHLLHTVEEEIAQFTEFYRLAISYMGVEVNQDICKKLAEEIVCNDAKVSFYKDVHNVLRELKQSYRIAILSDTWPSLRRILDNAGISPILDALIMSCDYNETKGGTKLFETAASQLKENPGNILFVDDSLSNLSNAEKAGFVPVHMDRDCQYTDSPYPIAKKLSDIQKIINDLSK